MVERRLEEMIVLIKEVEGKKIMEGEKREENIIEEEEKKGKKVEERVEKELMSEEEEKEMLDEVKMEQREVGEEIESEDLKGEMMEIEKMSGKVDILLEKVMVNEEEGNVREKRMEMIEKIREEKGKVEDLQKIEG